MPRKPKVAVIGAGIGGLTAAVALHQRDIDVEVYEQSPQIAEIGAGVSLSPNAVKAFRALGLDAPITAIGFESDNQLVRAWNSGDVISRNSVILIVQIEDAQDGDEAQRCSVT